MSTATRRDTTPAAPTTTWWSSASCRSTDPEVFFPAGLGGQIASGIRKAKRVCQGCPVRSECLQWAMDADERNGVWGGLSGKERRARAGRRPLNVEIAQENLPWIREQLAQDVSIRQVAEALKIGHWSVRRALELDASRKTAGVKSV